MKTALHALVILSLVALGAFPVGAYVGDSPQAPPAAWQTQQGEQGVVVEQVRKGFAAEQAGLQPGDLILRWSRPARPPANPSSAEGAIRSPFDLMDVEMEQGARGPVTLHGSRDGSPLSVTISRDLWKITARPGLPAAALEAYELGVAFLKEGRTSDATNTWRGMAKQLREGTGCSTACQCWLGVRIGRAWADAGDLAAAREAYLPATQLAEASRNSALAAAVLEGLARALWEGGDFHAAEETYRDAIRHRRETAPGSLGEAAGWGFMAELVGIRGDHEGAMAAHHEALALREAQAPDSLWRAISLIGLGNTSTDIDAREGFYMSAAAVAERVVPDGPTMSAALTGLGIVALERGDLAAAERHFRRSLDIDEVIAPGSRDLVASYENLGNLALHRGDLTAAEDLLKETLALAERMPSARVEHASALLQLGIVAQSRRRLAEAEDLMRRSLAEYEAIEPEGLEVAGVLHSLGEVVAARGNAASAEEVLTRSAALSEKIAPQGRFAGYALDALGDLAIDRGDWEAARGFHARALAIRERISPASAPLAQSLHGMATVMRAQGREENADGLFRRAIDTIEEQRGRVGGSEDLKALFASGYVGLYSDYIQFLVDLRRSKEAFDILERCRARSLLALMAERDLIIEDEVPPQLERERRRGDAEYERTGTKLGQMNAQKDAVEIERLTFRLHELREQRGEVSHKIREASPRLADLRDPQPLDAEGVRASLDPGTVFLAYSVGKENTVLFVLTAAGASREVTGGVQAITIPVGEAQLRERVDRWRRLAERMVPPAEFSSEARALYDLLIRPAELHLRLARRLLVSPDGPLHQLPFAALRRGNSYLAEWKPLSVVPSGTFHAQMARSRGPVAYATDLEAFGDPRTPDLDPLPSSRREVKAIARLFRKPATHLGAEATEERAKAIGKGVRYVHFAAHGLIDERLPLDSSLALSATAMPGDDRDNGRLHAWEIIERMRLNADLVTLSACRSAAGTELAGEGLIGLTRAFQYAGARSVLASLWSVGDMSTFELMSSFYGLLKSGLPKDEALRRAQMRAIQRGRHPARWASFQLYGDWR